MIFIGFFEEVIAIYGLKVVEGRHLLMGHSLDIPFIKQQATFLFRDDPWSESGNATH